MSEQRACAKHGAVEEQRAMRESRDAGSGSVLAVALAAASLALVLLAAPLITAAVGRQSLDGAADASALGAAQVDEGIHPGIPCVTAARIAVANGSELDRCDVDGLVVTVVLRRSILGITARAAATAGPSDAVTN